MKIYILHILMWLHPINHCRLTAALTRARLKSQPLTASFSPPPHPPSRATRGMSWRGCGSGMTSRSTSSGRRGCCRTTQRWRRRTSPCRSSCPCWSRPRWEGAPNSTWVWTECVYVQLGGHGPPNLDGNLQATKRNARIDRHFCQSFIPS